MRAVLFGLLATSSLSSAARAEEPIEITVYGESDKPTKPDLLLKLPQFDLKAVDFQFPSGLRVLFQRDTTEPIIAITAVTDHGSSDDPLGKEGIAHLVEHLWFRSEQEGFPKLWDVLQSEMGCDLNAFTQSDITAYMTSCASQNLEQMMRFEAQRMTDTVKGVTQDMVTTEIEVVRNEIRMRGENFNIPFFTLLEFINKHTYPEGHPYHRPIAGDHTTIRNCKLEDIQTFTQSFYRPSETTVMVVGDLPTDSQEYLLDLVLRTFDLSLIHPKLTTENLVRWPRDGIKKPDPENPDHWYLRAFDPDNPKAFLSLNNPRPSRASRFADLIPSNPVTTELGVYEGAVEDPAVAVAWTLPAGYQGNDTLMQVTGNLMSSVIGQGMAQLDDPDVDEFGGCAALPNKRSTVMLCVTTLKKSTGNAERIAGKMVDQIIALLDPDAKQFLDLQFTLARNQFLVGTLNSVDVFANIGSGRATNTSQHAHFTGSGRYFNDTMMEINKLTTANVVDIIEKYILDRKRISSVFVKPQDRDEVALQSEDTAGAGGHYRGGDRASLLNPSIDPKTINPALVRQEMDLPDISKISEFTLPNGLRVVVLPHAEVPLVNIDLIVGGGSASEGQGLYELTQRFTTFEGRDIFAVNQPLRVAGDWRSSAGATFQSMGVRGVSGNLDGLLWMLRQRLDTTKPDLAGKPNWVSDRREALKKNWYKIDWHFDHLRDQHLNPGHPLGDGIDWEDLDFLGKASTSTVGSALAQTWQPANATLLIVGKVAPEEAKRYAQQYFGGWQPQKGVVAQPAPAVPGPNPAKAQAIYIADDKGKTQTEVTLMCPLKPATESPSAAHQLLGDLASLTLFTKLREEAGVVYSPQATAFVQDGGSAFMYMSALIQNDSATFAAQQYLAYLEDASNGRLSDVDLKLQQLQRARGYVLGEQSIDQMTGRITGAIIRDQPWSTFENYAQSLANVTLDDLADLTKGCADHAIITFQGPIDDIKAQLDEAKLAYTVVDKKEAGDVVYKAADPKGFDKYAKARAKSDAKKEKDEAKEKAKKGEESGDDTPAEPTPAEPAPAEPSLARRD